MRRAQEVLCKLPAADVVADEAAICPGQLIDQAGSQQIGDHVVRVEATDHAAVMGTVHGLPE